MQPSNKYSYLLPTSKTRWRLFKVGLVTVFGVALFYQLRGWQGVPGLIEASGRFIRLFLSSYGLIPIALVLANILMESSKWQLLVRLNHPISLRRAVRDVLSGWALGIFTPQRVGEYAGRLLSFPKEGRKKGLYFVFIGSIAQNMTHLLGIIPIAIWWIRTMHDPIAHIAAYLFIICIVSVVLYAYFHLPDLMGYLRHRLSTISYLKKIIPSSTPPVPSPVLLKVLLLSILRYGAYLSLFVFLLKWLAPGQEVALLYLYVPLVFALQSGFPLPPAISFLARIEFALISLRGLSLHEASIAAAGIWLWVLNLLLPSLVGLVLVLLKKQQNDLNKTNR